MRVQLASIEADIEETAKMCMVPLFTLILFWKIYFLGQNQLYMLTCNEFIIVIKKKS